MGKRRAIDLGDNGTARATSSAPVLDPWVGFTVMVAWVAVALAVAAVQMRRRDA